MDLNRPNFGIHHHLVLSETPLAAQNLRGKKLIEAGALTVPGLYVCEIQTSGLMNLDVYLEPTAANAGGTPTLSSMSLQANPTVGRTYANSYEQQTIALDVATGVAFVANTIQKLSLTGLNGTWLCKVQFTVTTSVDFTVATTHGRAEVRGL